MRSSSGWTSATRVQPSWDTIFEPSKLAATTAYTFKICRNIGRMSRGRWTKLLVKWVCRCQDAEWTRRRSTSEKRSKQRLPGSSQDRRHRSSGASRTARTLTSYRWQLLLLCERVTPLLIGNGMTKYCLSRRVHEAVQVGECSTDRPFIPVQRICRRDFAEAGVLELRVLVDSDHGVTYRVGSRRRGTCLSSWGNTGRGSCWAD